MAVSAPFKKVTQFIGRASGDCECFCFDRRTQAEHDADEEEARDAYSDTEEVEVGSEEHSYRVPKKVLSKLEKQQVARIYPSELLPKEVHEREFGPGVLGHYKITVEFTPLDYDKTADHDIGCRCRSCE